MRRSAKFVSSISIFKRAMSAITLMPRPGCISQNFQTLLIDLMSICFNRLKRSHSSGIDVFAAPRSKFASEDLNVEALDALFSMIAKRYDLVFIDLPVTWFSWTTQIIAACDGAVITGLNTIPNCDKFSRRYLLFARARPR